MKVGDFVRAAEAEPTVLPEAVREVENWLRQYRQPVPEESVIVPGPIYGFRIWEAGDYHLYSGFDHKMWAPREPRVARCVYFDTHRAPEPKCTCGIFAVRHLGDLVLGWRHAFAVGRVALWGRIAEHELGWRAERAYPSHVVLVGVIVSPEKVEKMARNYGVPFEILKLRDWNEPFIIPRLLEMLDGKHVAGPINGGDR